MKLKTLSALLILCALPLIVQSQEPAGCRSAHQRGPLRREAQREAAQPRDTSAAGASVSLLILRHRHGDDARLIAHTKT